MSASYAQLSFSQTSLSSTTRSADIANNSETKTSNAPQILEGMAFDSDSAMLDAKLSSALLKNLSQTLRAQSYTHTYFEAQELDFKVLANIKTRDREYEVAMSLHLSRSFVSHTQITAQTQIDPLVISLDAHMPKLSQAQFRFDIDSDGKADQISLLEKNSAFLVLDKNQNGKIDDGRELFGTQSGDGFFDLAAYDEDQNGWIDANDPIFHKLRIWKKTAQEDQLLLLGEVGIGAVFLGNIKTPFSLKDDANNSLGELRSSGFFLFENGKTGVVSHIDFTLAQESANELKGVEELQKNLKKIYSQELYSQKQSPQESQKPLEVLQKQLKTLESKLQKANDDEKPALQVQIGVLYARIIELLQRDL